ncbi:hypothetical protein [Mycoplasma suis]|uniref:Uncharacterized protein n=1 Tax=Mycoplasma suis (strain Illinois) TaxID=768700 RepID=F0QS24_MYCSL|nr:hypothetical protein [Mycoplasma suis]ADX98294.1 hypothetical protein MSU_0769 [Mycoplasma suis str. Illinois]
MSWTDCCVCFSKSFLRFEISAIVDLLLSELFSIWLCWLSETSVWINCFWEESPSRELSSLSTNSVFGCELTLKAEPKLDPMPPPQKL